MISSNVKYHSIPPHPRQSRFKINGNYHIYVMLSIFFSIFYIFILILSSSHNQRLSNEMMYNQIWQHLPQTGYIKTNSGSQLFFWLFQSRSGANAPLTIWLNGG